MALSYCEKFNFSVIPVRPEKKPFIKWEEYQKRRSTLVEIGEWWGKWPGAMIGIVTGKISGICVIDIDEPQGHEEIQKYVSDSLLMPTVRTPREGHHLYFQCPNPAPGNNARVVPGCDFRGEGGYIIAPPSANGVGKAYEWAHGLSLDDVEPPALPEPYILFINLKKA